MTKPIPEPKRAAELATRIRDLRELTGLTQQQVADHLGLEHRSTISDMEKCKRGVGALEATELARLFRVPLERLMEGL